MKFPAGIAADYYRDLRVILRKLWADLQSELPHLSSAVAQVELMRGDSFRQDATPSHEILMLVRKLRLRGQITQRIAEEVTDKVRSRTSKAVAEALSKDLRRSLRKGLQGADEDLSVGIGRAMYGGVTAQGKNVLTMIEQAFVPENVSLIESIPRQFHDRVEHVIWSSIRAGKGMKEIKEGLRDAYALTDARAKLIARDQAGKLFGQLNKARQQDAGLKSFIWRTIKDNRVRESHRALEGKTFSWENGAGGLFPGEDYQCRCQAEPNPAEIRGEEVKLTPLAAVEAEREEEELYARERPPVRFSDGQFFEQLQYVADLSDRQRDAFALAVGKGLASEREVHEFIDKLAAYQQDEGDIRKAGTLTYSELNTALRDPDSVSEFEVEYAQQMLEEAEKYAIVLEDPLIVYRGTDPERADAMQSGPTIDSGFCSVTLAKSKAADFGMGIVEIELPKGTRVLMPPSQAMMERELILLPGSYFVPKDSVEDKEVRASVRLGERPLKVQELASANIAKEADWVFEKASGLKPLEGIKLRSFHEIDSPSKLRKMYDARREAGFDNQMLSPEEIAALASRKGTWDDIRFLNESYMSELITEKFDNASILHRTQLRKVSQIPSFGRNDPIATWNRQDTISLSVNPEPYERAVANWESLAEERDARIAELVKEGMCSEKEAREEVIANPWLAVPPEHYTVHNIREHTLRHELGHAILDGIYRKSWNWEDVFPWQAFEIPDKVREELWSIFDKLNKDGRTEEVISQYAKVGWKMAESREQEAFAEAFALYTGPFYTPGRFPPELEEFLEKVTTALSKQGEGIAGDPEAEQIALLERMGEGVLFAKEGPSPDKDDPWAKGSESYKKMVAFEKMKKEATSKAASELQAIMQAAKAKKAGAGTPLPTPPWKPKPYVPEPIKPVPPPKTLAPVPSDKPQLGPYVFHELSTKERANIKYGWEQQIERLRVSQRDTILKLPEREGDDVNDLLWLYTQAGVEGWEDRWYERIGRDPEDVPWQEKHRLSLKAATQNAYALNGSLRGMRGNYSSHHPPGSVQAQAVALAKAVKKNSLPLPEDVIVYRGFGKRSIVNSVAAQAEKDGFIVDHGLVSTSLNPEVALRFNDEGGDLARILVPKGAKAFVPDQYLNEMELILPPGTKLEYLGRDTPGFVDFRVVPDKHLAAREGKGTLSEKSARPAAEKRPAGGEEFSARMKAAATPSKLAEVIEHDTGMKTTIAKDAEADIVRVAADEVYDTLASVDRDIGKWNLQVVSTADELRKSAAKAGIKAAPGGTLTAYKDRSSIVIHAERKSYEKNANADRLAMSKKGETLSYISPGPITADSVIQTVVSHELGHAVFDSLPKDDKERWGSVWEMSKGKLRESLKSSYCTMNRGEGFAEAFAAWRDGVELPLPVRAFMKRVAGGKA